MLQFHNKQMPQITKEALQQLVKLQAEDKVLDTIQAAIDKIPVEIATLRKNLEEEKARMTEAKTKLNKLQLAKKEKEQELAKQEEAIRKHGGELNQVKTNEAYRALQNEIDKAKSNVSDLETAILTIMDELDQAAKEDKAEAAKAKELDAKTQGDVKTLEAQQAEHTAKRDEQKTKRDALAAGLPEEVTKLYEYLRKRKQGVALATVNGNMCAACRVTIMPQSLVDLAKGHQIVTCESCQRILYRTEAVTAAA